MFGLGKAPNPDDLPGLSSGSVIHFEYCHVCLPLVRIKFGNGANVVGTSACAATPGMINIHITTCRARVTKCDLDPRQGLKIKINS